MFVIHTAPCRASSRVQHKPYDVQELQKSALFCMIHVHVRIRKALQWSDIGGILQLEIKKQTHSVAFAVRLQNP